MLARSRGADGSSASATADVVERTADAAAAARDAGDVDGRLLEEAGALLVALEEAAATLRDAHGVDGGGLASFRKLRRPADYAEGLASAGPHPRIPEEHTSGADRRQRGAPRGQSAADSPRAPVSVRDALRVQWHG